jgi:hypothetical protein
MASPTGLNKLKYNMTVCLRLIGLREDSKCFEDKMPLYAIPVSANWHVSYWSARLGKLAGPDRVKSNHRPYRE